MKLSVPASCLKAALSRVSEAVARQSPHNPVFRCVLVRAADLVTVSATDTEIAARVTMTAPDVFRPGAACVQADTLSAIVNEAGPESVTLETDKDTLAVRFGAARYELPTVPADKFPEMPQPDGGHRFELPARTVVRHLGLTSFAADKRDSARFAMQGLLIEAGDRVFRSAATDSKRIAIVETAAPGLTRPEKGGPHLIPRKAVALLERNLPEDDTPVVVVLRPNEAYFENGGMALYCRLIEGRFPPVEKIMPAKTLPTVIELPKAAFAAAIRTASIMTDAESKRVEFSFAPGGVTLQSRGATKGASEVELSLPGYDGPAVGIAFDPAYVSEYLKAADGDELRLELAAGDKPALFRCGEGSRYLVMPLVG